MCWENKGPSSQLASHRGVLALFWLPATGLSTFGGTKGFSFRPLSFLYMQAGAWVSFRSLNYPEDLKPRALSDALGSFPVTSPPLNSRPHCFFSHYKTHSMKTQGPFRPPPSRPAVEPMPFGSFTCSSAMEHGTFQALFEPPALIQVSFLPFPFSELVPQPPGGLF